MKTWNTPVVEEMNLSQTQYGGSSKNDFDKQWQNQSGEWECTFKPSK